MDEHDGEAEKWKMHEEKEGGKRTKKKKGMEGQAENDKK